MSRISGAMDEMRRYSSIGDYELISGGMRGWKKVRGDSWVKRRVEYKGSARVRWF